MLVDFDRFRSGHCLKRGLASFTIALTALIAAAAPGHAQTLPVDCAGNSGALASLFQGGVAGGTTVQVTGTCIGKVFIFSPFVTIDGTGGGEIQGTVDIATQGVTLSNITIDGTGATEAGIIVEGGSVFINVNDVTVQNFPDSGASLCCSAIGVNFNGGTITGSKNCGVYLFGSGVRATLGNDGGGNPPVITANGAQANSTPPPSGVQGGICVMDGAFAEIDAADVRDNIRGAALTLFQGTADVEGGTFQAPSTVTFPAVQVERGTLNLANAVITGTGKSNAIFATPGSAIKMQATTVSQSDSNDATILVEDGSTLLSVGGNTISNGAANGIAIAVANASTFHEKNETSLGIPLTADTITGGGNVQLQSNMELGTGTAPSNWTGNINVVQNSSFRLDGGIKITGGVTLAQGSNGFFNRTSGGANSIVTGQVACAGSSSHVAGANFVVVSGTTSAVTLVTSGTGCYTF